MNESNTYKRCGCRDRSGRLLNSQCPHLSKRGHGSWYFRLEMPAGPDGRRRQLRRGGFPSRKAARQARDYLRDPGGRDPSPATITAAHWLALWLETRLGPSESTLRGYRHHVRDYLVPRTWVGACSGS